MNLKTEVRKAGIVEVCFTYAISGLDGNRRNRVLRASNDLLCERGGRLVDPLTRSSGRFKFLARTMCRSRRVKLR
jgi:hypothetical protein